MDDPRAEYDRQMAILYGESFAGVDEAGRGPLAGPVVAASCVLPLDHPLKGVDDSKRLSHTQREKLYEEIVEDETIKWAVGVVDVEVVDRLNILQATIAAMLEAVDALDPPPNLLLVDGLHLEHPRIPCRKIIKGDALSRSIAAASIIAKVTRDRMMIAFDSKWPEYGFAQHKGYGTKAHLAAIERVGPCPLHRCSFEPLKSRLALAPA